VQGFYYAFASLLALQSLVEMGFGLVVVSLASHEWAYLRLNSAGRIEGDPDALSRLLNAGGLIFKWHTVGSAVFVVGVGVGGHLFFRQHSNSGIRWEAPWLVLVILAGVLLWSSPFNSLLEGCNQLPALNRFRFKQALLSSLALWGTLALGGGLWAATVSTGMSVLRALYLLFVEYRRFFEPFLKPPLGSRIDWRTEMWPMQWRLALHGAVNYLTYSLFTPVIFQYQGAAAAGRIGMTLQIVGWLQAVAMTWIHARVPELGILVSQKNYVALDKVWLRSSLVSLGALGTGSALTWLIIYVLNLLELPLSQRLLPLLPTGLLLVASTVAHLTQCQAAYLRAHKREPLVTAGVVSSLAVGALVWVLGSEFGATGAATAYLLVMSLVSVPWITAIWFRCRDDWHARP
jgi:O-antigen/teichoic acid export membrane protein